jgi:hypothetical protein
LAEDIGPLHLYGNVASIPQLCAMHLPQRRRRQRLVIEGEKCFRDADFKLVFDRFLYIRKRHALDVAAATYGDAPTTLHATDAGRRIYERMGYQPIASHTAFIEKRFLEGH